MLHLDPYSQECKRVCLFYPTRFPLGPRMSDFQTFKVGGLGNAVL